MYITAVLTPDQTVQNTTQETAAASAGASSTGEASQDFSSYLKDCQSTDNSGSSLTDIFKRASETYGVSMSLLTAMAKQESNFQPNATSKSGAMGIMQLMPATAASLGVSDAYDPEQNIMGGAKYISSLLQKYNGDTSLALAAYNAGSNNVDKYGGIPPFAETQDYVAKITAYMRDGVTLPDGNNIAGSTDGLTSSDDTLKSLLGKLFTYNDYQKFLTLFAENMKDAITSTLSEKLNQSSDSSSSSASTAKEDTASAEQTTDEQTPAALSVSFKTIGGTPVIPVADSTDNLNTPDVQIIVPEKQTSDPNLQYEVGNIRYNNSVLNLISQQKS